MRWGVLALVLVATPAQAGDRAVTVQARPRITMDGRTPITITAHVPRDARNRGLALAFDCDFGPVGSTLLPLDGLNESRTVYDRTYRPGQDGECEGSATLYRVDRTSARATVSVQVGRLDP